MMNKMRDLAAVLAVLYVFGGTAGHLHGGLEDHADDVENSVCSHGAGAAIEAGCEGPCSNSQHHHHSASHDPHVCSTCQFLGSPVLAVTMVSQERITPPKIFRVSTSKRIPQKLKLLVPPLRAPPQRPLI